MSAEKIKKEILQLTKEYYNKKFGQKKEFQVGDRVKDRKSVV